MLRVHAFVLTGVVLVLPAAASLHAAPVILEWTEQLGTGSGDYSYGVSADSLGNVYISGRTDGSLGGPSAGGADAFLAKYNASGTLKWTEQFGTGSRDYGLRVSADSLDNVYITGDTYGSLGGPNAGLRDAFVAKFAVPEPSSGTLALVGLAALTLLAARRRRRRLAETTH